MKKTILFLGLTALLTAFAGSRAQAYDHDKHGWYDEHHHRHDYIVYHHHRGFWDQRNGAWIFINI